MWSLLAIVGFLQAIVALPQSLYQDLWKRDDSKQVGYISVSVATLWTNPHKPRPVDEPALTNPVHIEEWLDDMTVKQFLDLTDDSRTQAQALYGNQIYILQSNDGWYEIAVPGQPTPKNTLGYPGWVPACQISFDTNFGNLQSSLPFAQVDNAPWTGIYRDADMIDKIMDISYDTKLPVMEQYGTSIQVAVPGGGLVYVSAVDATVYDSRAAIPYPTGEDLAAAGSMFLGRPYLWGESCLITTLHTRL
jgi:gamma-D-glutamyl-L-lysine dipeptidyl-peptidase